MEEDWGALCAHFDISGHEDLFSDSYFGDNEWYVTCTTDQNAINHQSTGDAPVSFDESQCEYVPQQNLNHQMSTVSYLAENQRISESFFNVAVHDTECNNTRQTVPMDLRLASSLDISDALKYLTAPTVSSPSQSSTADSVLSNESNSSTADMSFSGLKLLRAAKDDYFTDNSSTGASSSSLFSCADNSDISISEWSADPQWTAVCSRTPHICYLGNLLTALNLIFEPGPGAYTIAVEPDTGPHNTIRELIDLSGIINQERGFNNLREHQWLSPAYSSDQIEGKLNPTFYVAVLRSGLTVTGSQETSQMPAVSTFEDLIQGSSSPRRQKNKTKSKKRRPSLKSWDPVEVFYPLGYISHDKWIHMLDLQPDERYWFDCEEFQSQPPYDMVTSERQADCGTDISDNQYDAFYLRSNPDTGLRECYCGCCKTWHKRDQCNWLHHMKSAHGIRSRTKQRYALPHIMSERPDKKANAGYFIGFCDKCQSWQNVNNSTAKGNYASWFLHQASHDVERNKLEGCSGKKLSRTDVKRQQYIVRELEINERKRTLCEIERLILMEMKVSERIIKGQFFCRAENFVLEE